MKYTAPSFTVPASGKAPENCAHGWIDGKRGRCVLCGEGGFIRDGAYEGTPRYSMTRISIDGLAKR